MSVTKQGQPAPNQRAGCATKGDESVLQLVPTFNVPAVTGTGLLRRRPAARQGGGPARSRPGSSGC
jgi:hypothetical protein